MQVQLAIACTHDTQPRQRVHRHRTQVGELATKRNNLATAHSPR